MVWVGGCRTGFVKELDGEWVYGYDGLGRLESVTDPAKAVTGYTWNDEGRLGSVTQPGGNCASSPKTGCITYTYDLAGRPTGVDYAELVKGFETRGHADWMSASRLGSLIQALVGSSGGVGRRLPNRAGFAL